ncbi:cation diffusion facilitator family transporter [Athalassotoga saccharophila]|uniref:cation diffusion facilitator family transporter n=1 Tax=Athalassotoga saccharophila TaxID=1441386 RepID=UPI00137B1586|nr:cation diffusion facilitator family transporter [Athalassotoga saccharophila]BBJ27422.1 cadmium, cobalt and zinc/H(+)-K(+) antiporter [Athalassotoga saccharophila]
MNEIHDHASKALWANVFVNFGIVFFELSFGIISGSFALITDSLHNLEDAGGMILSLFANIASRKPGNERKTYGYKRSGVIVALINSIILLMTFTFLGYEASVRLIHPENVNGEMIMWVGILALAGNTLGALLLHGHSHHDLNIKAAFIHMLSDSMNSAAVIIVGILIGLYHWYILDPLVTFGIIAYISYESFEIIGKSINVLMEGVPVKIDFSQMKKDIESIEGVLSFHHVHLWSLDGEDTMMECHVRLNPSEMKNADIIRSKVNELIKEKYRIDHLTIQIEGRPCPDESLVVI